MHNLMKQSMRKGILSAALALLLCMAIGFSVIGVTAWRVSVKQANALTDGYVTIAVPREQKMDKWDLGGTPMDDGSIEWGDGSWYISPARMAAVVADAPGLQSVDHRCLLGAHVDGKPSLSSGALDELGYNEIFDRYRNNLCVLAVECTDVSMDRSPGEMKDGVMYWGSVHVRAHMKVLELVSLLDTYGNHARIKELDISTQMVQADGTAPFEKGKTYLIRGFFEDYPIAEVIDEEASNQETSISFIKKRITDWHGISIHQSLRLGTSANDGILYHVSGYEDGKPGIYHGEGLPQFTLDTVLSDDLELYQIPQEGSLPWYTEFHGPLDAFLNSEEGKVWKEKIIPMCSINQESASVILTDNVQSLYCFNTGDASILDGRDFSFQDYSSGAPCCLVSAAYAQYHDLKVGDTLSLDFYNSGYGVEQGTALHDVRTTNGMTLTQFPLVEETRLGIRKDYEIIGIYSGPDFTFGVQSVQPNTIFVPKKSVPNASVYEDHGTELLNSYILKNGSAEEFEAYMERRNMGDLFLYFDQNYEEVARALQALRQNAFRMFIISVSVFALAASVFLYLQVRNMNPVARGMRLLGVSRKQVCRELIEVMIFWTVLAAVVGTVAGMGLYHRVTVRILSEHLVMDRLVVAVTAIAELLLLILAEAVAAIVLSGRNLMQFRKKS